MRSLLSLTHKHKIIIAVLFFDILVLFLHLTFGHISSFFHLDFEHNLPTIYQSAKLIAAGTISTLVLWQMWIMSKVNKPALIFFGFFAAGFIFLGLDELGQLHEHIDFFVREVRPEYAETQLDLAESLGYYSSTWILYYTPIIVASIAYFIYGAKFVWDKIPARKTAYLLMLFFFAATIFFEFVSNQREVDPQLYQNYITYEETAEMLGATAGLAVVLKPFLDNSQIIKKSFNKVKKLGK